MPKGCVVKRGLGHRQEAKENMKISPPKAMSNIENGVRWEAQEFDLLRTAGHPGEMQGQLQQPSQEGEIWT